MNNETPVARQVSGKNDDMVGWFIVSKYDGPAGYRTTEGHPQAGSGQILFA
jgi:hypothetical protein